MLKLKNERDIKFNLRTLINAFLEYSDEITDTRLKSIELIEEDNKYAVGITFEDGDWYTYAIENE